MAGGEALLPSEVAMSYLIERIRVAAPAESVHPAPAPETSREGVVVAISQAEDIEPVGAHVVSSRLLATVAVDKVSTTMASAAAVAKVISTALHNTGGTTVRGGKVVSCLRKRSASNAIHLPNRELLQRVLLTFEIVVVSDA